MNYTYIVQCSDGTLYTGWTNDLNKRIKAHNNGKGAKYTKPRLPVELVYAKEHATKEEAMKDEYRIKQLPRQDKQKLCREYEEEQSKTSNESANRYWNEVRVNSKKSKLKSETAHVTVDKTRGNRYNIT